jgi:plasmid maintenance system antidote protein VapI
MTPDRLRECLAALRWSQRGAAEILGMDPRQMRRMCAGSPIPPALADWLERAAQWHEQNPPPPRKSA